MIKKDGVEAYEGSVRYLHAAQGRGPPPRGRLLERQLPGRAEGAPGSRTCSRCGSTASSPTSRACRASRRPTPTSTRPRSSASSRSQAAVFEDALAGVESGRAGNFGCVVGVDRVGQADELAQATARTSSSRTSRSCSARPDVIRRPHAEFAVDRLGRAREHAGPRLPGPDGVGVRALQRPHRPARQPRRGRAPGAARHLPERLLRAAAAALRRDRLRPARGGPDRRQRDQRQGDPAAGRRRALRHPLRRAAKPRAHARLPRRHAAPRGRVVLAGRSVRSRSARRASSRSPSARSRRSPTRSSRSARRRASSSSPSWSPTSRSPRCTRTRARRLRSRSRSSRSGPAPAATRRRARAPHPQERPADGRRR